MEELQPTSSDTNLEPTPPWDADPTFLPLFTATPNPPPPDSLPTDPPQTHNPDRPLEILVPSVGVPWRSGLFDCCQQPTNAIITTVAPCVTFGQISEILDNGSTSCLTGAFLYFFLFLVLCYWNIGVRYRTRLRNAFQLAETPLTDRVAHILFPFCSLCQEFRELKHRGLDPFQGYQRLVAKQSQQGAPIIPPPSQAMMR